MTPEQVFCLDCPLCGAKSVSMSRMLEIVTYNISKLIIETHDVKKARQTYVIFFGGLFLTDTSFYSISKQYDRTIEYYNRSVGEENLV